MNRFINSVSLILILHISPLLADDLTTLREQIKKDQTQIEFPVTMMMVQKQAYLVAVGTAEVKGSKPEALVQARQVAQFYCN